MKKEPTDDLAGAIENMGESLRAVASLQYVCARWEPRCHAAAAGSMELRVRIQKSGVGRVGS